MEFYTLIYTKYLSDIDANIYLYSHNKTKAKVCVIKNDDNNKYFTIAFRTPPKDNTGVCHILEHSVLCGSNKYPIKDPYKELLKSSVNTFLNAMTYSDKTMYPCASTNDLDFKILMDVYLDAVFNPLIYKNKEIFEQEGYHYEVKENKIICNGVVYNEMQGIYSDPEQILYHEILKSLYPGSSYGFESGGYPKEIPNLSYEEFLDYHKNYYHPSNCYIYLYGNCDVEERLNYIALNYLNKFEYSNYNTEIEKSKCSEIKEVKAYYEVNDTNKNDTYLSYNLVLSSNKDMKLILAIDLILTILLQNPNAKITKKLVELGICKDINVTFDDQILTPFISIVAYGSNKDKEKEFVKLLNEELNYYAINGLDKELLRNQIEYNIFKNKEFNLSANKGLSYILGSLASLLYDNSDCYSHLEVLKYYEMLKEEINTTYFNEVIKDYLLNNNHKSYVSLEPKVKENKVHEFKNNLDKEELNLANLRLKEYQEKEDSEEVLAKIPKLKISDLNKDIEEFKIKEIKDSYLLLHSDYSSHNLIYLKYLFNALNLSNDDILYLSLLSLILKHLPTSNNSSSDLVKKILKYTGGLSFRLSLLTTKEKGYKAYFTVSFSLLSENIKEANLLINDIINNTIFNDEIKLKERLEEIKINLETSLVDSSVGLALNRCLSYLDESFNFNENISGLNFYYFISNLVNNYDSLKKEIINKLERIKNIIFVKDRFLAHVTCDNFNLDSIKKEIDFTYNNLSDYKYNAKYIFKEDKLNEGFITDFTVNYVALGGRYEGEFTGQLLVLNNILNSSYLWDNVRVLGGAYGSNIKFMRNGLFGIVSYQDPNISKTYEIYYNIINYLENLELTEEKLNNYKVGTIGQLEQPLSIRSKGERALFDYLRGYSLEDNIRLKEEVINTTLFDIKNLKNVLINGFKDSVKCAIGNGKKIKKEAKIFKEIKLLQ